MSYKTDLSIAVVEGILKTNCNALITDIDAAYDAFIKITDAKNGQTELAWARDLFNTADTLNATLTVDAATKTISCLAGAGLFANFRVARDVQITNFTNGGNNQTVEVKEVATDGDSITLVDSSSGWVNETDTNARVRENPNSEESDRVTAILAVIARFSEFKDALDNAAVSTADRRADLMDWIW